MPRHRTIVALDIEGSTTRTNPAKARIRDQMYDLFGAALRAGGITERHHEPLIDRGDGLLALVRPVDEIPKTVLLSHVIPRLTELLPDQLRLRAVVHAGEVHADRRGFFGEALDIACRLLDAPALKAALRRSSAPLVLAVSDDIHRSVVRHGYAGIDDRFQPITVDVGGRPQRGWVLTNPAVAAKSPG